MAFRDTTASNIYNKLKEQYKKGEISFEEWDKKTQYLNKRRQLLLPNEQLFGE